MSKYIIQTEPESLDDYKEIVKNACGYLNNISIQWAYLLQDYKEQHGNLKGMLFSDIMETMLEDR